MRYALHVEVFLIRHAEAIPETAALSDSHRHLTAIGRDQARALGDRLRWHDCVPTHVWSSPLVRAIQTAELVASGLACGLPVEAVPALAPGEDARTLAARLSALPATAIVVVVGHEPSLSLLGSRLVSGPDLPALRHAQAARIVDGELRWRFACHADAPEMPR
jgi:phosphohistidine phosphatase